MDAEGRREPCGETCGYFGGNNSTRISLDLVKDSYATFSASRDATADFLDCLQCFLWNIYYASNTLNDLFNV